jgi:uncharacterized protein
MIPEKGFTMRRFALAVIATCFAAALPASAQGISCGNAVTGVERTICADPDLFQLDNRMSLAYRNAVQGNFGAQRSAIVAQQRVFVLERERCQTETCIGRLTRNRLAELRAY